MEKNTILAIGLSIVVIVGSALLQAKLFPKEAPQVQQTQQSLPSAEITDQNEPTLIAEDLRISGNEASQDLIINADDSLLNASVENVSIEHFTIETTLLSVDFTNAGGDITSYKLKAHTKGVNAEELDMILSGDTDAHAFAIAFGGRDALASRAVFAVRRISDLSIEFYRDFFSNGKKFTLTKRYNFKNDEYMFELQVTIDGGNEIPSLNFAGANGFNTAYTLQFGPQIGPSFTQLDEREDYRHYHSFVNGKQKIEKVTDAKDAVINSRYTWLAIAGKYFTFFVVPDATQYEAIFSTQPATAGINASSRLFLQRPPLSAARSEDTYRFYLGPKTQNELAKYDNNDNGWGYSDLRLETVANASGFWGILSPLEKLLKWFLNIFYKIVPNYGVAIILVTLLVKILLFPLTKKGSEGTIRMQVIGPKIKELQDKYKDNPQKMNVEMAALYKKEGYNPLSGCLPMLIQMPIFLAMYNLFNNHFELRGAMFIAGWIPDLSVSESIWNFAPYRIPFLGWSDLRLLPFIYVASQLLYTKIQQTPDQAANKQMMLMMKLMPLVFFFVLYNVPAGMLIYWIMSNIFTLFQQMLINKMMAPQKAAMLAAAQAEANAPRAPHKNKKRKR
ncbi:MAG: membrane protein insertase YidC [Termitinemataceae bacterium]|nr:MAG: membrane protein insertase YidC [Termitinemataceae bacterium]